MNGLVVFFASGTAFYVGLVMVLVATALGWASVRKTIFALRILLVILAIILILLSATPLPGPLYLIGGLIALAWLAVELLHFHTPLKLIYVRLGVVIFCVILGLMELPYTVTPAMPAGPFQRVYLVGDSISAGIGTSGVSPWPQLMRDAHGVEIIDLARSGATLESASRMLEDTDLRDGLVLLEIGGNDLLGRASANEFERDLDRLLQQVAGPGRSVVMFELPLLPTQNAIGHAQRRLARKHGVTLIPKRVFASILGIEGGTLDGLHLSAVGHQVMAQTVWEMLSESIAGDVTRSSRP